MEILMIILFLIGYACIALEHTLNVNKAATALVMFGLIWTIYALHSGDVTSSLMEHLGSTCETLVFLIGAMTIVEIIDIYGNRKVYSYEDEVRRQYVLPKDLYPSYEDVQVAATVLDFINAFNYDFDYVYDNDLNHFRSSLATERLLAQMLNND